MEFTRIGDTFRRSGAECAHQVEVARKQETLAASRPFSLQSYAAGVADALEWARGELDKAPMEDFDDET